MAISPVLLATMKLFYIDKYAIIYIGRTYNKKVVIHMAISATSHEDRRAKRLRAQLNTRLAGFGYADAEVVRLEALIAQEKQRAIEAIDAKYQPVLSAAINARARHVKSIQTIVGDDAKWAIVLSGARGKTLKLRSGEISRRLTSKTEVNDEAAVLASLRKIGRLRAYTKVKVTLDRQKLLRVPELVRKLKGIDIVNGENMVLKPIRFGRKTERELPRLSRPIR